ncbi:hypothetical protein SAMN04487950_3617 [Halogranum rubrum]|uniref:Uncharacterized protein n=1 Tax=Halogranum rubrum TaxID=553466 RepID=A0A1I4HD97_9EURY|nr:hypothetical protein [Halogranum rubrum]SFL39406.1 hypothetical protein SAMN04487950_3617 [Halogranum rubrum]
MPSTELSADEVREIAREETRKAIRSELRGYAYGVVGLVVGFLGLPLLFMAASSGNLAVVAVVVVALVGFTALLLW